MKKLLTFIAFIISFYSQAQVQTWNPPNPDSLNISILNQGVVNQVKVGNLTKTKVSLVKHTTDSALLRTLLAAREDSIAGKKRIHDSVIANAYYFNSNYFSGTGASGSPFAIKKADTATYALNGGGGSTDTTSLSNRINAKIDSGRAASPFRINLYANGSVKSSLYFDSTLKPQADSVKSNAASGYSAMAYSSVDSSLSIGSLKFYLGRGTTGIVTNPLNTYLTWTTIGSDMEQYNSNLGMRKKTTASAGWNAAGKSLAVQTLSSGQSLTVKIGTANAYAVMLSDITTPDEGSVTGIKYGFYPDINGTVAVTQVNNATVGGTISVAVGDLMRITYNAQMAFDQSTDGGTTWTNKYTSTGTAPSGSYYIVVQSYSVGGGYSEIYKR